MPIQRFRGTPHRQLLARLPRNLLLFDGQCRMSQARIRYVMERNFSFFSLAGYATGDIEDALQEGLDQHAIRFASLHSAEGTDLVRRFLKAPPPTTTATARPLASPPTPAALPMPADLVLVFIEKVPSKTSSFLNRVQTSRSAVDDRRLFGSSSASAAAAEKKKTLPGISSPLSASSSPSVSSGSLADPQTTDLLVSTNFVAMCRVGMHLDRWLPRMICRLLYYCVPQQLGGVWFDRFISVRRREIWGTSEEDAGVSDHLIDGMKERRWTWQRRNARKDNRKA